MQREAHPKRQLATNNGLRDASILVPALFLMGIPAPAKQNAPPDAPRSHHAEQQHERRIVVSVPERRLALVVDGQVVKIYRIAVGAPESPSPEGHFSIVRRITNPTYYAPGVVVPPGPENPLGTRWIGLDLPHFGIHGTNQPHSIGHYASHGCIRMRNRDMEDLFPRVRAGDAVDLLAERTEETARIFGGPLPAVLSARAEGSAALPNANADASMARE